MAIDFPGRTGEFVAIFANPLVECIVGGRQFFVGAEMGCSCDEAARSGGVGRG